MRLPLRATQRGRLLRRYKRFFADVETPEGEVLTVHCPDPGSMRGVLRDRAAVRCSRSDAPHRKLAHTLEMIRSGRIWVGVHTALANRLVERVLEGGAYPPLAGYARVRREVRAGESRLDFRLEGHPHDPRPAWVEVKSVTLAAGARARFPDSVTARGRRHVDELLRLHRQGDRAVLLYLVQRADCDRVEPADDIDPAYASALRAAAKGGVEVHALRARVTPTEIRSECPLPVVL